MKLIRPTTVAPTDSVRGGDRLHKGRQQWLIEWLADQPKYVMLSCGDKLNINSRSVTIIKTFADVEIFCERHDEFATVDQDLTTREYLGIPAIETPEIPLF